MCDETSQLRGPVMFCSLLVGNKLLFSERTRTFESHFFLPFFLWMPFFFFFLSSCAFRFLPQSSTVLSTFCQRMKISMPKPSFLSSFFFVCVCAFGPDSASACRGQTPFRSHNPATLKPWICLLVACLYLFGMAVKASQNFRSSRVRTESFSLRVLCDRR